MIRATEGRIGPKEFGDLCPSQVWGLYFRPRDKEGKLIRPGADRQPREFDENILPFDLGIPDEAYTLDPDSEIDGGFVRTFWAVWRVHRKRTVAETWERWKAFVQSEVERRGRMSAEVARRNDGG